MTRPLLISCVDLSWPQVLALLLFLPLLPQCGLSCLSWSCPVHNLLVMWRWFLYIPNASSSWRHFLNKEMCFLVGGGGQSTVYTLSRGLQPTKYRSWWAGNPNSLVWQWWHGVCHSVTLGLSSHHASENLIGKTPMVGWPPFSVSLLLSLTLFSGITFQINNLPSNSWLRGCIWGIPN